MAWQIGVDVGGTFTDLLALDPQRGVFRVGKVLSTPEDQSIGFIAGLAELETDLAAVAALVHGTTDEVQQEVKNDWIYGNTVHGHWSGHNRFPDATARDEHPIRDWGRCQRPLYRC